MSAVTIEQIGTLLGTADDEQLARIVSVIDRLSQRRDVDTLLDAYRARLARIRPPRPATIARIVTLPFEDLLVPRAIWTPGRHRIPRDHLQPLHAAITAGIDRSRLDELTEPLHGRGMDDAATVLAVGHTLWPLAAAALEREATRSRAQGQDRAASELRHSQKLAARLLGIADGLVPTLWQLPPRPMVELSEEARRAIQRLLTYAAQHGKETFHLAVELLICRSDTPTLVLDPVLRCEAAGNERERHTCAAVVADGCIEDMRLLVARLAADETIGMEALAGALVTIVSNIESLEEVSVKVRLDRRELGKVKAATTALLERRMTALLGGDLLARFGQLPTASDPLAATAALEEAARAATRIRLAGRRLGLATRLNHLFAARLPEYAEAVAGWAATASGRTGAGPAELMDQVRVVELLFGSDAAMKILRRHRAGVA